MVSSWLEMCIAAAQVEKTDRQKHSSGDFKKCFLQECHHLLVCIRTMTESVNFTVFYDIKNGQKQVHLVEVGAVLWMSQAALKLVCYALANSGCISCFP